MNWLWLNIPLMAVFFLAVAGIPLWLVLRRPDFVAVPAGQPRPVPVTIAARSAAASHEERPRQLAGSMR